jgi:hypothetical protein
MWFVYLFFVFLSNTVSMSFFIPLIKHVTELLQYSKDFFIHQLLHKWIVLKTFVIPNSATHTHTNKDLITYAATPPPN